MRITEILKQPKPLVSFEFFPPKSEEAADTLFQTIRDLMPLQPAYVSVTYGAGGGTRGLTHDLVVRVQKETELTVVSHLTCVGSTREEMHGILERYNRSGIENILALRGDPPGGAIEYPEAKNGFQFAADLIAFIKRNFPKMGIGVAGFPEGHPATPNRLLELDHLKAKVDAGTDYICTQMFFENRDYFDFCERCDMLGIHIPIIPGIMPITSVRGMERMASLALGCRFPSQLQKDIRNAATDEDAAEAGIRWAADQVRELLEHNVPGIHFYTLNRSRAALRICEILGIRDFRAISE